MRKMTQMRIEASRVDCGGTSSLHLTFGIPDIELGSTAGNTINPASFAGHQLVALFAPLDFPGEEIAAYKNRCDEFAKHDAWLLIFSEQGDLKVGGAAKTFPDPDRHAWVAFRNLTPHPEELDRQSGATFLFSKGGCLHRFWHGSGHIEDVIAELGTPASEQMHELRPTD
jgi:hypothetical protein